MKRRHCSVCHLPGHDKRSHGHGRRSLRRNIDAYTDRRGVVHPIRGSAGYSSSIADSGASEDRTFMREYELHLRGKPTSYSSRARREKLARATWSEPAMTERGKEAGRELRYRSSRPAQGVRNPKRRRTGGGKRT